MRTEDKIKWTNKTKLLWKWLDKEFDKRTEDFIKENLNTNTDIDGKAITFLRHRLKAKYKFSNRWFLQCIVRQFLV